MTARVAPALEPLAGGHGRRATLRSVFESITAESCPYRYNFHLHSVFSDGCLTADAIISQAIQHGLEGLTITDHHSVDGYFAARRWLDHRHQDGWGHGPSLSLWTGVEITAELLGTAVHILGYDFDPNGVAIAPYLTGQEVEGDELRSAGAVIQAIHRSGGIAVLAHPMRYRLAAELLVDAAAALGIDGLEAFYAYKNPEPWAASPEQTARSLQLAEQFDLLTTCGTDSHGPSILRRL